jgi:hypothetical protein
MKINTWTDALRSGKYSQGFDMLYDAETKEFDPIGVACDLINPRFKKRDAGMLNCIDFVVPVTGELAKLIEACPLVVSYVQLLNSFEVPFSKIANEIDDINEYWGNSVNYAYYCEHDGPDAVIHVVENVLRGG